MQYQLTIPNTIHPQALGLGVSTHTDPPTPRGKEYKWPPSLLPNMRFSTVQNTPHVRSLHTHLCTTAVSAYSTLLSHSVYPSDPLDKLNNCRSLASYAHAHLNNPRDSRMPHPMMCGRLCTSVVAEGWSVFATLSTYQSRLYAQCDHSLSGTIRDPVERRLIAVSRRSKCGILPRRGDDVRA
jgi:hypothetical protein